MPYINPMYDLIPYIKPQHISITYVNTCIILQSPIIYQTFSNVYQSFLALIAKNSSSLFWGHIYQSFKTYINSFQIYPLIFLDK